MMIVAIGAQAQDIETLVPTEIEVDPDTGEETEVEVESTVTTAPQNITFEAAE